MILMICGSCQIDMVVRSMKYSLCSDGEHFQITYELGCENLHVRKYVSAEYPMPDKDTGEYRIIQYLIQQAIYAQDE